MVKIPLPIYRDIHDSDSGRLYHSQRAIELSFKAWPKLTWVYLWKHSLY